MRTPNPDADDAPRSRIVPIVVAIVLVLAGAAAALFLLSRSEDAPAPGALYFPAQHLDVAGARLVAGADGTTTLAFTILSAVEGEHLKFTLRRMTDPKSGMVFVDRGDPTSTIGMLTAKGSPTGKPEETRVEIALPVALDRVHVVDLRWGRWEGFEATRVAPK